jgi:competence protein ComGC
MTVTAKYAKYANGHFPFSCISRISRFNFGWTTGGGGSNVEPMKPSRSQRRNRAFTMMELIIIAAVIIILAAIIVPRLAKPKGHRGPNCSLNLMTIGLASKIWAGDHNDKYPFELSITNGGTMELERFHKRCSFTMADRMRRCGYEIHPRGDA